MKRDRKFILLLALALLTLTACNLPVSTAWFGNATPTPAADANAATITFRVRVPAVAGDIVLAVVDEVTGLNINPRRYPMTAAGEHVYETQVPAQAGAVLKYRYERHNGNAIAIETQASGVPVRYRLLRVDGDMLNEDMVARWNDTPNTTATGRIEGQITDTEGRPVPDVLVTAGGVQAFTLANGKYLLENVPAGEHTLVAYHIDGRYRVFQQRARVAENATTPANITLEAAPLATVQFTVTAPADTVVGAPLRLAGNLYSLGNAYADIGGGLSTLASRMPTLTPNGNGQFILTLQLPVGADIHYKYTLGDGFWNAEHNAEGHFVVRELIVPPEGAQITDAITTWHSGSNQPVWFEVSVPANTPAGDIVDLQLNPAVWTAPLPMWPLGENRWGYQLYSPTNLPGDIHYRFCRSEACNATGEADPSDHTFRFAAQPQQQQAQIAWRGWQGEIPLAQTPLTQPAPRENTPWLGVAWMPAYRPAWQPYTGRAVAEIRNLHANRVVFTPTWSATLTTPPVWEPRPGNDPLVADIAAMAATAHQNHLNVALFPTVRFPQGQAAWWESSSHDFPWWVSWFDRYAVFADHFAHVAQSTQAQALILGGAWVQPAVTGNTLPNGAPSGVPADAEARWRKIIADTRAVYQGQIYWALPLETLAAPPAFLDTVDGLYVLWAPDLGDDPAQWEAATARLLDDLVKPVAAQWQKPIVLAVAYPSAQGARGGCVPADEGCLPQEALFPAAAPAVRADMTAQQTAYAALLNALAERPWVNGVVSADFYPPARLQDASASVHGKPAAALLAQWFAFLNTP